MTALDHKLQNQLASYLENRSWDLATTHYHFFRSMTWNKLHYTTECPNFPLLVLGQKEINSFLGRNLICTNKFLISAKPFAF